MATKTITILEEVYNELIKLKREEESFSEELSRLIKRKGNLIECAGLWNWMKDSELTAIEETISERRKLSQKAKKDKSMQ